MKILSKFSRKMAWLSLGPAILIALVALVMQRQPLLAAGTTLAPGDIVFTGYITNGVPDSFSFVTFIPLDPGTVIYFTDNGWTGSGFLNVTNIDAGGTEGITRITINNPIAAGAIIRSNDTSADFTWDISSPIGAGDTYSTLGLSQGGDQLAAVQSTNLTNPFLSGFTALAQIDYTSGFEPATNKDTGALISGLSQADGTALLTNNPATYAAFNLNALSSGDPSAWRTAIANLANWTFNTSGTSLPTGTLVVSGTSSVTSITTQPAAQTIVTGTATTLNVVATGAAPLSYQWYQGNTGDTSTPISGATVDSFTTPILTVTTSYWVRVSNNTESVDSATATVTVIDPGPLNAKLYLPALNK